MLSASVNNVGMMFVESEHGGGGGDGLGREYFLVKQKQSKIIS